MQPDIKKFNREVRLLKFLGAEPLLHPLRQEQIKQQVLEQISLRGKGSAIRANLKLKRQNMLRYLAATMAGLSLFGGTVLASENSVPGDALFPVKLTVEKFEAKLARTEEKKAEVEAKHAENRLEEYEKISTRVPTSSPESDGQEDDKIKSETEAATKTQVKSALETLATVKEKLESKGNTQAAQALEQTMQRLKDKAESSNLHVQTEAEETRGEVKSEKDVREGRQGPKQEQKSETNLPEPAQNAPGRDSNTKPQQPDREENRTRGQNESRS